MSASTTVELLSPVSTRTQVTLYWVTGRMETTGTHDTSTSLAVILETVGPSGAPGTPVRWRKGGGDESKEIYQLGFKVCQP